MNETEKMPEINYYKFRLENGKDMLVADPGNIEALERFCKRKNIELENVYATLESYGVPRERAGRASNGIMVLMSRMQKEINGYEYNIQKLEEEKREAVVKYETMKGSASAIMNRMKSVLSYINGRYGEEQLGLKMDIEEFLSAQEKGETK